MAQVGGLLFDNYCLVDFGVGHPPKGSSANFPKKYLAGSLRKGFHDHYYYKSSAFSEPPTRFTYLGR